MRLNCKPLKILINTFMNEMSFTLRRSSRIIQCALTLSRACQCSCQHVMWIGMFDTHTDRVPTFFYVLETVFVNDKRHQYITLVRTLQEKKKHLSPDFCFKDTHFSVLNTYGKCKCDKTSCFLLLFFTDEIVQVNFVFQSDRSVAQQLKRPTTVSRIQFINLTKS